MSDRNLKFELAALSQQAAGLIQHASLLAEYMRLSAELAKENDKLIAEIAEIKNSRGPG